MAVPVKQLKVIIALSLEKARNVAQSNYNSILELNQLVGVL